MPDTTVFIAGTDTAVGKTHVTAALARSLQAAGIEVHARKPVQSFDSRDGATDAQLLSESTGEAVERVCPRHRWYELALAPPMAADQLGRPRILVGDLVKETDLPSSGVTLIEGVGGPRSPLAHDGDSIDLARALNCDRVLLVGHPGLGTLNSVLLGVPLFAATTTVFLNRYEVTSALHDANRRWLQERGLDVTTSIDELVERLMSRPAEDAVTL